MSALATLLLILWPSSTPEPGASRTVSAPCQVVEEKATKYFEDHDFYASSKSEHGEIIIDIGKQKHASTPSGEPLSLNRLAIRKYTLPRHLSPFKAYENFRLDGHLRLVKAIDGSCTATLEFEISAYEYVWALGIIDDGYKSPFISNGTLEQLYIAPIGQLFAKGNL